MPETDRPLATRAAWWPAIEVLVATGVANARTGAPPLAKNEETASRISSARRRRWRKT